MSKRKRKQQNALAQLKNEVESNEIFKGQKVQLQESGEKMSEILGLFIKPYAEYATDYRAYNNLVATAVIAWNAALMEGNEQRKFLNEIRKTMPNDKTTQEDFIAIVEELIERKKRFFADNHRNILDYKVVDRGHNYHLAVVSTPDSLPQTKAEEVSSKSSVSASVKNLLDAVFGTKK